MIFNIFTKFLNFFLGDTNKRTLKKLEKWAIEVQKKEKEIRGITDQELREKGITLKKKVRETIAPQIEKKRTLQNHLSTTNNLQKVVLLQKEISKEEKLLQKNLEEILHAILPEAFAIIINLTRRFTENKKLVVKAEDYDHILSETYENITIKEGFAHWENNQSWKIIPFFVQILGSVALHKKMIVEMATGEGKTIVATLTTFLHALAGEGVHIVTVNSYLAKRDAKENGWIFQFFGLSVDCINCYSPRTQERRRAYVADITYGTAKEFGFDYLRDNIIDDNNKTVQRKLHSALIDEIDFVLIDQADTPLIIAEDSVFSNKKIFKKFNSFVKQLYQQQKSLMKNYLDIVKKDPENSEAGKWLFSVYKGLSTYEPFIALLSQPGIRKLLGNTENYYLEENKRRMPEIDKNLYFTMESKSNNTELTDKGIEYLGKIIGDPDFFILEDLSSVIANIENNPKYSIEQKVEKRKEIESKYFKKNNYIHATLQLLKAYVFYKKDKDYAIINNQIILISEATGRFQKTSRLSDGMHQAIEAKENVPIQNSTQICASITLQNYFRMYQYFTGMSGSLPMFEFKKYGREMVVIPTNKPLIRKDYGDILYKTYREKMEGIRLFTKKLSKRGHPVLLVTASVEDSENLYSYFNTHGLKIYPKQVLNAKNHSFEADIIQRAGVSGNITIATNMAGRGTDIKIDNDTREVGGLVVILCSRNKSQRIDKQIKGRTGRQGDPGICCAFTSLEEEPLVNYQHSIVGKMMEKTFEKEGEFLQEKNVTRVLDNIQISEEHDNYNHRKRSLEYDDVINRQRDIVYKKRKDAMTHSNIDYEYKSMIWSILTHSLQLHRVAENSQAAIMDCFNVFGFRIDLEKKQFLQEELEDTASSLFVSLEKHYQKRKEFLMENFKYYATIWKDAKYINFMGTIQYQKNFFTIFSQQNLDEEIKNEKICSLFQRKILLQSIDGNWKKHLLHMEELQNNVQNSSYEQNDPLLIYKKEAFPLFQNLIKSIYKKILSSFFHGNLIQFEKDRVKSFNVFMEKNLPKAVEDNNNLEHPTSKPKRNEKITVRYSNGNIKKDVKYKHIEDDLMEGKCEII